MSRTFNLFRRGDGLAPAAVIFGQSGTPVPTVIKQAFINSLTQKSVAGRDAAA